MSIGSDKSSKSTSKSGKSSRGTYENECPERGVSQSDKGSSTKSGKMWQVDITVVILADFLRLAEH